MLRTQPFSGFRDAQLVPLICPTCQAVGKKPSIAAAVSYCAWGCFRYFCWEQLQTPKSRPEAAFQPEQLSSMPRGRLKARQLSSRRAA
jgi:hypothetical protein